MLQLAAVFSDHMVLQREKILLYSASAKSVQLSPFPFRNENYMLLPL